MGRDAGDEIFLIENVGRDSYSGSSRAESSEGVEDHGFTERVIDDFEESSSSEEDEYDEEGQEGEIAGVVNFETSKARKR